MVVVTVEHHDVDRRLAKGARRAQAAEAGPHDEDRGSCRGPGRGPPRLREAHRCGLRGGTGHVAHLVGGGAASYCFCRTTTMRTPLKVLSPCSRAAATPSGMSRKNVSATCLRVTESPARVQVPTRLASKSATPGFEAGTNSRPVVPPSATSVRSMRDPRASWFVVTPAWVVAKLDAR